MYPFQCHVGNIFMSGLWSFENPQVGKCSQQDGVKNIDGKLPVSSSAVRTVGNAVADVCDLLVKEFHCAVGSVDEPQGGLQRRRVAGTIGSDDTGHLAGGCLQAQAVNGY